MIEPLALAVVIVPLLAAASLALPMGARSADRLNLAAAVLVVLAPAALCVIVLSHTGEARHGRWWAVDPAGADMVGVTAIVGLLSASASPRYLATGHSGFFAARRERSPYYVAFYLFWAALFAVVMVDNLAIAWLLIEATTAASALLVAFSARRGALEAGWKYLALTTLGLAVALLGIIVLYALLAHGHGSLSTLNWSTIRLAAGRLNHTGALLALVLILGGLATKIGWAPVHHWLPDAHSEAPPPISAMMSAALLPAVMLVAWRVLAALAPTTHGAGATLFMGFGLASLAVAVPFLWRALPLKRLLAYSSLEHMGILAIGIGFASPLATAGVLLHLAGHALSKSLGFYTTIPLLRDQPELSTRPVRGLAANSRPAAAGLTVALGSLSGLPPSPLFLSEVLILLGGVAAGKIAIVAIAAGLLALGFLGLAHALIEGVVTGRAPRRAATPTGGRPLAYLTAGVTVMLLVLAASSLAIEGSRSGIVSHVMESP